MKKLEIEAKTHHKTNYHKQTIIKQTNQKIRFGLALNSQTKQMMQCRYTYILCTENNEYRLCSFSCENKFHSFINYICNTSLSYRSNTY